MNSISLRVMPSRIPIRSTDLLRGVGKHENESHHHTPIRYLATWVGVVIIYTKGVKDACPLIHLVGEHDRIKNGGRMFVSVKLNQLLLKAIPILSFRRQACKTSIRCEGEYALQSFEVIILRRSNKNINK